MTIKIDLATATQDELALWLAGQTVACSHVREDGKPEPEKVPGEDGSRRCYACVDQKVPGQVTRFPTLRGPCPCGFSFVKPDLGGCWRGCQGRGWIPNVTTDTLLQAVGTEHRLYLAPNAKSFKYVNAGLGSFRCEIETSTGQWLLGFGMTHKEALLRALVALVLEGEA